MFLFLSRLQIFIPGFVPRSKLPEFYSCLDVLICSSVTIKYETFGIANVVSVCDLQVSSSVGVTSTSTSTSLHVHPLFVAYDAAQEALAMGLPLVHYGIAGLQVSDRTRCEGSRDWCHTLQLMGGIDRS